MIVCKFPSIFGDYPNIIAQGTQFQMGAVVGLSGALIVKSSWNNNIAPGSDDGVEKQAQIEFNASKSNSIFGASDTVQVAGLFVQCLIRYA